MYYYITVDIVMTDCKSVEDAKAKCSCLLPYHPDENTRHMESWEIIDIREGAPQVLAP
jgi:hypothetical protein